MLINSASNCGYHYQSDVDAGRLCASVGFAAVQSSDTFQKQMAKAKKEADKLPRKAESKDGSYYADDRAEIFKYYTVIYGTALSSA